MGSQNPQPPTPTPGTGPSGQKSSLLAFLVISNGASHKPRIQDCLLPSHCTRFWMMTLSLNTVNQIQSISAQLWKDICKVVCPKGKLKLLEWVTGAGFWKS